MALSKGLKDGAVLLTLKLPKEHAKYFTLVSESWVKMTWGRIVVYVLTRNNDEMLPAIA